MPDGKQNLPEDKKEGKQGSLPTVIRLVTLVELILRIIEIALDLWR
ncbi:hypothetical protein FACS1894216_13360 [Synergistales bacterium]|nr:hypothetical protein FACS1894216_13330 [Synergistales bacterium]GHV54081.1 hypothetical protein FACS1894216_13360 [Synergistales bacterium]